ncbi:MAG TPA: alpha/beta hydrolase [Vicinamibacterales bacterium]|nr:alpha/beta hydrolase [Vicinamibacterales bacterium]
MIDSGSGTPIVLIPGLQGRWEWMRPAVSALARHHRVITFSLCDEKSSPFPCDPKKEFDNFVDQVELALDRAGVQKAVIAGVSYGGLIATEFAAKHPDRVSGLVLASALHTSWEPDERQRRYLAAPVLMSPMFVATAPQRMRSELNAALPTVGARLRFSLAQAARVVMAPARPSKMARRIAWAKAHHFADPHSVTSPVLLVTGEPGLDRIVPVDVTRRYLKEFESAEHVVLKRTGHIGLVTRPEAFAGVLERFVNDVRVSA